MVEQHPNYIRQSELIDLLCELTKLGKATWLRGKDDVSYLYCFIDRERITVDFCAGEERESFNLASLDSDDSFSIDYKGEMLLYLGGLCKGDKLIDLVKSISILVDDAKIGEYNERWNSHLLDNLVELKKSISS